MSSAVKTTLFGLAGSGGIAKGDGFFNFVDGTGRAIFVDESEPISFVFRERFQSIQFVDAVSGITFVDPTGLIDFVSEPITPAEMQFVDGTGFLAFSLGGEPVRFAS